MGVIRKFFKRKAVEQKRNAGKETMKPEEEIKEVKEMFNGKVIKYDNMDLFFTIRAIEFITECKRRGIPIYGLDAFRLSGYGIQPSMEHSRHRWDIDEEIDWDEAIQFITKEENKSYLYEILI